MGKEGFGKLILAGGIVGRASRRETTIYFSNEFVGMDSKSRTASYAQKLNVA